MSLEEVCWVSTGLYLRSKLPIGGGHWDIGTILISIMHYEIHSMF